MNDKNFDSLKNLKAPDSWIENALNIPNVQKEKPIFFIRYSRSLAAVACLILVCTISLLVVLNKNDGSVPAIDPDYETIATDSTNIKDDTHSENKIDATEKTNDKKDKNSVTETVSTNGGAPHESTENPQKPTQSQNTKPTDKPETAPTDKEEKPTNAPEVLPAPTVKPTRPQNSKPDMKPVNKPGNPGDPMKPPPTEGDGEGSAPAIPGVPYDVTFTITVDSYYLTSDETIYCTLISPNNETVLIDEVADIKPYGSSAIASLSVSVEELMYAGKHTCYFYSSNGYYIGSAIEYV